MVPADSHKASPTSRYSGYHWANGACVYGAITLCRRDSHPVPLRTHCNRIVALQPPPCRDKMGLGSFPFARHYLGNHCYFLFLCLLRCFSSAGSPPAQGGIACLRHAGLPHSETPGYGSYLQIPGAYRSLSRPSSPPRAKASPVHSFLLSSPHGLLRPWKCFLYAPPDWTRINEQGSTTRVFALCSFTSYPKKRPICCCMSSFSSISSNMSKNFVPRPPRGPFHIPPVAGGSGEI